MADDDYFIYRMVSGDDDGCYIATCVYGSYDCPEVWTLRRFRDQFLGSTLPGRAFIRVYYFLSPKLVRRFGRSRHFHRFWTAVLNRMVSKLHRNGYSDTPYQDINWRKHP